ncbi:hypothetical protein [Spiroplasma cantharicola]|uniref:Uncharacterized protein n=1 Tax=Spiroplasma cantharicola TaxID=362837 RepID=A0A0M3SJJ8_9MOLU|nr:hypothetical protein [Spiroplasma cantharicola]ALD66878.1 hypothetical protein SCANT_v1c09720 [Spiroplasma cantharicola]
MYLNPFERMKKQREEDERKRLEDKKEQERLARLETQMGFINQYQNSESHIKNPSKINTYQTYNNDNEYYEFDQEDETSLYNRNKIKNGFENNFEEFEDFEEKHFVNYSSPKIEFKRQDILFEPQVYNKSKENIIQQESVDNSQKIHKLNEIFESENDSIINSNIENQEIKVEKIKIANNKIISKDQYVTLKNKKELFSKNTLMVNHPELLNDMNNDNLIYINLKQVVIYSSPCLFFLKKFINNLPEKISLEDKKTLWERTSVLLAATDWGKTTSEIDDILEDLNITNDPEKMFINEFINLLDSYNFNEKMNIVITNADEVDLNKILLINEFISKSLVKIPGLSCRMNVDSKVIDISRIDEIAENFDYIILDDLTLYEELYVNKNNIAENLEKNKLYDNQQNFTKIKKEENQNTGNIDHFFKEELSNKIYKKLSSEIEDINSEEDYDPGIDSSLRINIDKFIEKQRSEILERKKLEEQEIIKRKIPNGFNPSILSKKEIVIDRSITPSEGRSGFQNPFLKREEGIEIQQRPNKEIDENLNLLNRRPINIEDTVNNKINQQRDTKNISVPGSWNKLKN